MLKQQEQFQHFKDLILLREIEKSKHKFFVKEIESKLKELCHSLEYNNRSGYNQIKPDIDEIFKLLQTDIFKNTYNGLDKT